MDGWINGDLALHMMRLFLSLFPDESSLSSLAWTCRDTETEERNANARADVVNGDVSLSQNAKHSLNSYIHTYST